MTFWSRLSSRSRIARLELALREVEAAVAELDREVDELRRERKRD